MTRLYWPKEERKIAQTDLEEYCGYNLLVRDNLLQERPTEFLDRKCALSVCSTQFRFNNLVSSKPDIPYTGNDLFSPEKAET